MRGERGKRNIEGEGIISTQGTDRYGAGALGVGAASGGFVGGSLFEDAGASGDAGASVDEGHEGGDPGPGSAAGSAGAAGEGLGELLASLNPAQRDAATHERGPLLILAGAGTGKTRVITRRIAWLVKRGLARPPEILAITFTNKAAREMKERIQALVPTEHMWVHTFHAMCARILRREIEVLPGYTRDFSIYDTSDKNQLIHRLIKEAGFDTTRFRPAAVGQWISDRKNRSSRESEDEYPGEEGIEGEVLGRVRVAYEEAMRKNNALDFDDLLAVVLELFEGHPGIRDVYATRFHHVTVDEYQDTNRIQYLLLRHLASCHGNATVCGDPDQSIYAWRGADVRNILDFERDFPDAKVVRLEQNYRSVQNILSAAQAVIRNNRERKEKDLWSGRGEGEPLVAIECGDENDEAREIAARILGLRHSGVEPRHIAIFYRANFMQRALERAFRLTQISYQVVGSLEFYQRREVKDLIAYLKLITNPKDDIAFLRAVNVPARGVGETSLKKLSAWAAARGVSMLAAASEDEARATIRGRGSKGLLAFSQLLANLEYLRDGPSHVAMQRLLDEIDYRSWLAGLAEGGDDVDREANVDELLTHAETYDREEPDGGLRGFLQDVALVSETDDLDDQPSRVTLMTLHAAKGLEFPVVFIAGLEEELLPHARSIGEGEEGRGLEEERRLFYVGMTRAKDRLFLTHARVRRHFGQDLFRVPSRFLEEIPPGNVEGGESELDEADLLGDFDDQAAAAEGLVEGAWVLHENFGRGRVERLVGRGVNARATVRFADHGIKQLLLQYARLEVLHGAGS